jgi:hypothetical protein
VVTRYGILDTGVGIAINDDLQVFLTMKIRFECPCGRKIQVAETAAGKRCRCPGCNGLVQIPAASGTDANSISTARKRQRLAPPSAPSRRVASRTQSLAPISFDHLPPKAKRRRTSKGKKNRHLPWVMAMVAGIALVAVLAFAVVKSGLLDSETGDAVAANSDVIQTQPPAESLPSAGAATDSKLDTTSSVSSNFRPLSLQLSKSSDPVLTLADRFATLAAVPNTTDAMKLVDTAAFEARVNSDRGSAAFQEKGMKLAKVIGNFSRRSFEGTPVNSAVRHWKVLGSTSYDDQTAVVLRYYCEPRPPVSWLRKETFFKSLVPLMSFEEFKGSAGPLFAKSTRRPGESGARMPSQPDSNGLLLPRAGFMMLCFDDVNGQPIIADIASPIAALRLSRVAGELFLRDYNVITFGGGRKEVLAKPLQVSVFGELPLAGIDMGIELDRLAYFSRYADAKARKAVPTQSLDEKHRRDRGYRVHEIATHVNTNSPQLQAKIDEFRKDFPNDPGADLITVCLPLVHNEQQITDVAAPAILASAERLYKMWQDPFLRYVQSLAAEAQGDEAAASRYLQQARTGGFETSEMHRNNVLAAVESKDKQRILTALDQLSTYWDPDRPEPTVAELSFVQQQWAYFADQIRLAKERDTASSQSRGGPGRAGMPGRFGGSGPGLHEPPGPSKPNRSGRPRGGLGGVGSGPPPGFRPGRPGNRGGPPAMQGPIVTVKFTVSGQFDVNQQAALLAKALNVSSHQFSRRNQDVAITLSYAGSVQSVADAITFGTVKSADETSRTIIVVLDAD